MREVRITEEKLLALGVVDNDSSDFKTAGRTLYMEMKNGQCKLRLVGKSLVHCTEQVVSERVCIYIHGYISSTNF